MSVMEHKESYERFYHGLRKASSRMKELSLLVKNKDWLSIARSLDELVHEGRKFYASKPMAEQKIIQMTDERAAEARTGLQ